MRGNERLPGAAQAAGRQVQRDASSSAPKERKQHGKKEGRKEKARKQEEDAQGRESYPRKIWQAVGKFACR
jgi:hypothetical protein